MLLKNYSHLEKWFIGQEQLGKHVEGCENFLWQSCHALSKREELIIPHWCRAFLSFLENAEDPLKEYLRVDQDFELYQVHFLELIADLSHLACQQQQLVEWQATMHNAADLTGIYALRFLSAWSYFNMAQPRDCIAECQQIVESTAESLTLEGQAFLDLHDPESAIVALTKAVQIDEMQIMAWFQLAKASYAAQRYKNAYNALQHCQILEPGNDEIIVFQAMVAIQLYDDTLITAKALDALLKILGRYNDHGQIFGVAFLLSIYTNRYECFDAILQSGHWQQLALNRDFIGFMPDILRHLQSADRFDLASTLLEKVS